MWAGCNMHAILAGVSMQVSPCLVNGEAESFYLEGADCNQGYDRLGPMTTAHTCQAFYLARRVRMGSWLIG